MRGSGRWFKRLIFILTALAIVACDSDDDDDELLDSQVRVVNAIVDAPELSIEIDEVLFDRVAFQDASGLRALEPETVDVEITYVDPITGDSERLVADFSLNLLSDTVHSVILRGRFDTPNVLLLEKPVGDVDDDESEEIEIQAVNLASDTSAEVFLQAPSTPTSNTTPLATLAAGSFTEPQRLEGGDYRLTLKAEGNDEILYESRRFDIQDGARRTVVVHDSIGPDADALSAFLLTEVGSIVYPNEDSFAALRLVNAIVDEATVEIDLTVATSGDPLDSTSLAFFDASDFANVEPNFIDVSIRLETDPSVVANETTVSIDSDAFYTVVLAGSATDDDLAVRSFPADQRPIATAANLQFVNTLRETDDEDVVEVDLYALELGEFLEDASPVFSGVGFLSGARSTLPATLLDLVVTTAGSESILAGPVRVVVNPRSSLLVVATEAQGGGLPAEILVRLTE